MNKRLRKKKNKGEYRCWAFSVTGKTPADLASVGKVPDDLAQEICAWGDTNGFLVSGRVGGPNLDFDVDRCRDPRCCVGKSHPFGAKEEDRKLVRDWLETWGCEDVKCSPLWDVYR